MAGTICLVLGALGILFPGLPTTPFLLLAAALYSRSSKRLHKWLINNRLFGEYIKNFKERKAISLPTKISSISLMWIMIICSCCFFVESILLRSIIITVGLIGTVVMIKIPTYKP